MRRTSRDPGLAHVSRTEAGSAFQPRPPKAPPLRSARPPRPVFSGGVRPGPPAALPACGPVGRAPVGRGLCGGSVSSRYWGSSLPHLRRWSGRRDSNPRPSPWQGGDFGPSGSAGSPEVRLRAPSFQPVHPVRPCSRALYYRRLKTLPSLVPGPVGRRAPLTAIFRKPLARFGGRSLRPVLAVPQAAGL
jgi:hypothetical protein